MKKVLWTLVIVVIVFVIALIGGSFYMLDYSLAPDPNRMDTDSCYQQQFEAYPESIIVVAAPIETPCTTIVSAWNVFSQCNASSRSFHPI